MMREYFGQSNVVGFQVRVGERYVGLDIQASRILNLQDFFT